MEGGREDGGRAGREGGRGGRNARGRGREGGGGGGGQGERSEREREGGGGGAHEGTARKEGDAVSRQGNSHASRQHAEEGDAVSPKGKLGLDPSKNGGLITLERSPIDQSSASLVERWRPHRPQTADPRGGVQSGRPMEAPTKFFEASTEIEVAMERVVFQWTCGFLFCNPRAAF